MAMEVAMELELDDDVFFADISKQLNLLITDEDDEHNPISLSSSVSFQGLFQESYQTSATPYMMYQEQITYNQIRESKGTGVFIPRCSQPRRRHNNHQKKQGRFGSFIPKQQFPNHVHENINNSTTLNNNNNHQENINLHHHASINQRRTYRDAASLFT
ncbi:hypothetical protein AALP_AA3G062800 [Arabis alpina]|uniref:Uncharacterized protein n=1 Tax=Arabis alpina TaxID=50452 RepID=A0A087H7E1_ARAAL|nr:hypothetical protein AALP_AA3G062800 [Arabis alpina]